MPVTLSSIVPSLFIIFLRHIVCRLIIFDMMVSSFLLVFVGTVELTWTEGADSPDRGLPERLLVLMVKGGPILAACLHSTRGVRKSEAAERRRGASTLQVKVRYHSALMLKDCPSSSWVSAYVILLIIIIFTFLK